MPGINYLIWHKKPKFRTSKLAAVMSFKILEVKVNHCHCNVRVFYAKHQKELDFPEIEAQL